MSMNYQDSNSLGAIPEDGNGMVLGNSTFVPNNKKLKKSKSKRFTKRIKQYDENGNFIGEKTIKVDEFGNPIKKKKKSKKGLEPGESSPSTDGMLQRGDSMSSMGVMSAAEVYQRQFRPPDLPSWEEEPRQEQSFFAQMQYSRPQQEQQQNFTDFNGPFHRPFNGAFNDSKPSASSANRYMSAGPRNDTDFSMQQGNLWSTYDAPHTSSQGQAEPTMQSAAGASESMQSKSAGSKSAQSQSQSEMHHLVVQYMISAGADPLIAEDLATRFEEQQQRGMDTYAQSAARVTNTSNGRKSHDIDKFAMFAEEGDEGSVASAIIRALEQGAARAQREENEQMRTVSMPPMFGSRPPPPPPSVPSGTIRAQSMPIPQGPPAGGGEGLRLLLIQYLISVGTDPDVAETMADQFEQQQVGSGQGLQDPSITSGVVRGSSVNSSEQHEVLQSFHQKSMEAMNGGTRRVNSAARNGVSARRSGQPNDRMQWPRADRPGAVEMEGRAFGAPRRADSTQSDNGNGQFDRDIERLDVEDDMTTGHNYIEAVPVSDKELDIVYAESTALGLGSLLHERPVRRLLALVCLFIVMATVGATVFAVNRSSGGPVNLLGTISPTVSPTVAPSFVTDEIEQAAIAISGAASVLLPNSPQRRAVGWLSSVDEFDTQGLGLLFSERYIMTVLYYATHGEMWLEQERWLSPTLHVCDWSIGIICGTDLTRKQVVTGIDLARNGLNGQIPGEVGLIEGLILLRLAKNSINGTIPDELCESINLATLDLSVNQLSGPIPSRIGSLQDLLYLQLFDNLLTGPIPLSNYELKLLKELDLSKNNLSGHLSANVTKLLSLGTLNLQSNLFNGSIPSFRNLTTLDFIWLDHNQFSGNVPHLGLEMIGRQEVTVSHNRITGTVPGIESIDLTDFTNIDINLHRVDFSYNQLMGTLPPLIALVSTLSYFDISGNSFHGPLPAQASVNGWQLLEYFGAAGNQFTGTLALSFTTALSSLDVSNNLLNGTIPSEVFSKFPNLQFLAFDGNAFGGSISGQVGSLRKLRELHLNNCSLTGTIPDDLLGLTSLEYISLHDNELNGPIPSSIGSLTLLKALDLQNNQLTGGLPSEMGMLDLLTVLNVVNNQLTGTLPASLGSLSKLEGFYISDNFFLGSVPLVVCDNLQNLTTEMIGCTLECSCCQENGKDICSSGS